MGAFSKIPKLKFEEEKKEKYHRLKIQSLKYLQPCVENEDKEEGE